MQTYQHKEMTVEAVQFDGSEEQIAEFGIGMRSSHSRDGTTTEYMLPRVEGDLSVYTVLAIGDFIYVDGDDGERLCMDSATFASSYDNADGTPIAVAQPVEPDPEPVEEPPVVNETGGSSDGDETVTGDSGARDGEDGGSGAEGTVEGAAV